MSATLEVSPCEEDECRSKNRREALKEVVHLLRQDGKSRVYFLSGPQAPQCMIQRGDRLFGCAQCGATYNEDCRSYPNASTTRLQGTNIDTADFQLLGAADNTYRCDPLESTPGFLKLSIQTTDDTYDQIIAFFDETREVPITVNFFAAGTLRKVYRTFPKYFLQVDNQWIATVLRVRSTQGTEKAFVAETLVYVQRDEQNRYDLHLRPATDPRLRNTDPATLFTTN
jgi:hypothetical protein